MKKILLSQNMFSLIDDEDFDKVSKYKWCVSKIKHNNFYAITKQKGKTIYMHRFLMGAKNTMLDHINCNGLDNRKSNLRFCTLSENNINTRIRKNNKSGFKGVSWDNRLKSWIAMVQSNGKKLYWGRFTNKMKASQAYNLNASKHFGKFARVN